MLRVDKHDPVLFFHNEVLAYIFKHEWKRKTEHLLTKISSFVQFNNNVRLNIMMKR